MAISLARLFAMARKEAVQLRRDPRSLTLAFLLPLFLVVFFGYAITLDVEDIPLGVADQDRSPASRQFIEAFHAAGYFEIAFVGDRPLDRLLLSGAATAVLIVPPGFARDLAAGRNAAVQFLVDGSDANTATIALGYADAITARHSSAITLQGRRITAPVRAETRVWYNPELESRNMIVPGLIAVIMSIIGALLTVLTIAREWERGTMEALASTPVHRLEVVLGKLLPYLVIGVVDVSVTIAASIMLFDVPFRGSIGLLFGLTLLFLVGVLGVGCAISAALKSQVLATQAAMVSTLLPAVLLSGFLFDIAGMPSVVRAFTYTVPARYYIVITRGVFLKDAGLDVLWVQGLAMLLFAMAGLFLATRFFRKEVA
jgi:ABC-2 type transport system permease protein